MVWLGSYSECRDISNAHYCTTALTISVKKSISPVRYFAFILYVISPHCPNIVEGGTRARGCPFYRTALILRTVFLCSSAQILNLTSSSKINLKSGVICNRSQCTEVCFSWVQCMEVYLSALHRIPIGIYIGN